MLSFKMAVSLSITIVNFLYSVVAKVNIIDILYLVVIAVLVFRFRSIKDTY